MSHRILVIDDETNIRTMIKLALTHSGYEVGTASDGAEGLEMFGDGSAWDLVLLDQRMPGLTGIDVLREIFKRNPESKLILITAFGTIDSALEAIQAGASDFLRKPFTADTLRTAVKSALERPEGGMQSFPVGMVCREFTHANINGFTFELEKEDYDEGSGDIVCIFQVSKADAPAERVRVLLPAYVMELVMAYSDTEEMPCGARFWQALTEEALANYLWQNAELPDNNVLRIEDLSSSLQHWVDSVLTVPLIEEHAV
ncbi:MAG: response regulator [Fimbriimonas sp.]